MNRHPNIAFFGGTVVIAITVMAAFANVANAGAALTANPSQPKQPMKRSKKQPTKRLKPDQQWTFLAFCWAPLRRLFIAMVIFSSVEDLHPQTCRYKGNDDEGQDAPGA